MSSKPPSSTSPSSSHSSQQSEDAFHVAEAEFLCSAPSVFALPTAGPFEVAVVGRSNVGKSSFINRICRKKKLARTSATPGSTEHVVLFDIDIQRSAAIRDGETPSAVTPQRIRLADLPGYGFAKRSKRTKNVLANLVGEYLRESPTVRLLCVLNDIRRDPEEDEHAILELAGERGVPYLVVLTKVDKLTRSETSSRAKTIAGMLGLSESDLVLAGTATPAAKFWERVFLIKAASDERP